MTKKTTKNGGRSGTKQKKKNTAPANAAKTKKKDTMPVNTAKKKMPAKATKPGGTKARKEYAFDRGNISKKVPVGQILQTNEKNIYVVKGTKNESTARGYSKNGTNSRPTVVIDSNSFDELAIVVLTTKNGKPLPSDPKSKFRPYVEIYDDEKKPIKVGGKFIPKNKKLPFRDVAYIREECINHEKRDVRKENEKRLRKLKNKKDPERK